MVETTRATKTGVARGLVVLAAGFAVLGTAGPVAADAGASERGVVVRAVGADAAERSRSVHTVVRRDGDREVRVVLRDGEVTAEVDGERVMRRPASELREAAAIESPGGGVVVARVKVDADGQLVVTGASGAGASGPLAPPAPRLVYADESGLARLLFERSAGAERGSAPRVMIGITMGDVSETLAAQLGIDASRATVVSGVREGLPAEAAGLERYDVIVGVGASDDASSEALRRRLAEMEPGEELVLTVLRGGEEREVGVELEAYDPGRLGTGSGAVLEFLGDGDVNVDALVRRLRGGSRGGEGAGRAFGLARPDEADRLRRERAGVVERLESMREERRELRERLDGATGSERAALQREVERRGDQIDLLVTKRSRLEKELGRLLADPGSAPPAPPAPPTPGVWVEIEQEDGGEADGGVFGRSWSLALPEGLRVDAETRERVERALAEAMERLDENTETLTLRLQERLGSAEEALERALRAVEREAAAGAGDGANDRLDAIDQRLDRLERMLERLLEERGA